MELANRSIMTMQNYKPFNKLDAISAAPQWDATATYHENDPVVYKGRYYRCIASPTATVGTWEDLEWTAVALAEEIDEKAPLASPAFTGTPTAPTPSADDNSTKVATTAFVKTAVDEVPLRYNMPAAVALVAENDAATLVCADRAVTNATIATGFSTLNLTFPTAVSGKVRDFYLRIVVAAGESAPALSIPQGITIENSDGAVPEIADGGTDAASTTLVWFSETAPNVFTAKSETVKAVA